MIHQNHHLPTFSRIDDLQPQHLAPRVFQNPSHGGADFTVPISDHPQFPTSSPILPSAHPYSPSQYPFFQAFIDHLQQSWNLLDGAQTSPVSPLPHHAALPQASMGGSTSHITGVGLLPGGPAPSARAPPPKGDAEVLTSLAMTPTPGALPYVVPGPPFMPIPSPNQNIKARENRKQLFSTVVSRESPLKQQPNTMVEPPPWLSSAESSGGNLQPSVSKGNEIQGGNQLRC